MFDHKIADTDGSDLPRPIKLLKSPPCVKNILLIVILMLDHNRPVDQIEVKIVKT